MLRQVCEIPSVGLHFDDVEPKRGKVILVEVPIESHREVVRGEVCDTAERRGDQQGSAGLQHSGQFGQRGYRIGYVLEHRHTQHSTERTVFDWNCRDVGADVGIGMEIGPVNSTPIAVAVVERSILATIVQVPTEHPIRLATAPNVEQSGAGRDRCQRSQYPGEPVAITEWQGLLERHAAE